jgi:hypothetical protein
MACDPSRGIDLRDRQTGGPACSILANAKETVGLTAEAYLSKRPEAAALRPVELEPGAQVILEVPDQRLGSPEHPAAVDHAG